MSVLRATGGVADFEGRAKKGKESEDAPPSSRVRSITIVRGAADCRIKSIGKAKGAAGMAATAKDDSEG